MSITVDLSDEIYNRLANFAQGFDKPEDVIERLITEAENKTDSHVKQKPTLTFGPPEEDVFIEHLLDTKRAIVKLSFENGEKIERLWEASNFSPSSNLRANIWSGPLRGWKDKGIVAAHFCITTWKGPCATPTIDT